MAMSLRSSRGIASKLFLRFVFRHSFYFAQHRRQFLFARLSGLMLQNNFRHLGHRRRIEERFNRQFQLKCLNDPRDHP